MNQKNRLISSRKQNIAQHFSQAHDYNKHAHIQTKICEVLSTHLIDRKSNIHDGDIPLQYPRVLEIGAGQGLLTKQLVQMITANEWHINELCVQNHHHLQPIVPSAQFYFGDGEGLDFLTIGLDKKENKKEGIYTGFDLITSANTVQWFDNPLNFIDDAIKHLKPNGKLLFNSFTPNNFSQIKQLTGQGLEYPSVAQWQAKLQEYPLTNVMVNTHRYDLLFESPYQVLKHIKQTGVSVNVNQNFRWTTTSLKDFERAYQQLFSQEYGQVILSYEAVVIDVTK